MTIRILFIYKLHSLTISAIETLLQTNILISSENAKLKMGEDKFEEEKFMKALVNLKDTQESIQVQI